MRWIKIRRATIDPQLRLELERLGVAVVQQVLASHTNNDWQSAWMASVKTEGVAFGFSPLFQYQDHREKDEPVLHWLTEQYDRAERKETWSLTMEIAITVFVLGEVTMSILTYIKGC
jgi:hypothetical protein